MVPEVPDDVLELLEVVLGPLRRFKWSLRTFQGS